MGKSSVPQPQKLPKQHLKKKKKNGPDTKFQMGQNAPIKSQIYFPF